MALGIACLVYVAHRFASSMSWQIVVANNHDGRLIARVSLSIAIYAAGVLALALAWICLVRAFAAPMANSVIVSTYLVTQFGKYIPGNVAQYIGRHALLRRVGIDHAVLVACSLLEMVSLGVAASLFAGRLALHLPWPKLPPLAVAVGLVIIAAFFLAAFLLRSRWSWIARRMVAPQPPWLLAALVVHIIFFALMGATLLTVAVALVPPGSDISLSLLTAVAAASWMAGYVVPGAPAGLGVREAVMIGLLSIWQPGLDGPLVAASFRVATFGGDAVTFMLALGWRWLKERRAV